VRVRLVAFALLAACEAQPRVHVRLRGAGLDPAKVHVELRSGEHDWEPANATEKRGAADGVDCEIVLAIGPRQSVLVRGWYDANGNGVRDPGEPAGELGSAFEARDRGGCSERDANRAPDIVLVGSAS
jgi:hypothetical protein